MDLHGKEWSIRKFLLLLLDLETLHKCHWELPYIAPAFPCRSPLSQYALIRYLPAIKELHIH